MTVKRGQRFDVKLEGLDVKPRPRAFPLSAKWWAYKRVRRRMRSAVANALRDGQPHELQVSARFLWAKAYGRVYARRPAPGLVLLDSVAMSNADWGRPGRQ